MFSNRHVDSVADNDDDDDDDNYPGKWITLHPNMFPEGTIVQIKSSPAVLMDKDNVKEITKDIRVILDAVNGWGIVYCL